LSRDHKTERVYKRDMFCILQMMFVIVPPSRYLVLNRGNTRGWNMSLLSDVYNTVQNTGNRGASDVCLLYFVTAPSKSQMWYE